MGYPDLAEKYFIRLLNQLPPNDHLRGDLYEDLAKLAAQAKDYDKSLQWRKKALKFKNEHSSESSTNINPIEDKTNSTNVTTKEMINQVSEIMAEMSQLQNFTTPSYFFILPTRKCDKMFISNEQNWFRIHYKLYFLCECSHEANEMHVAPHEGYLIRMPRDFVVQYGLYLRTTLNIVRILLSSGRFALSKNGSAAPLKFNTPEEKETIKQQLDLVEALINKFDNKRNRPRSSMADIEKSREVPLQEVELRELETYLELADNQCTLGNLYRAITISGYVLWVCLGHYNNVSFNNEMSKYIKDFLAMGGKFDNKNNEAMLSKGNLTEVLRSHNSIKYLSLHVQDIRPSTQKEIHLIKSLKNDEFISRLCISGLTVSNQLAKALIHAAKERNTLTHVEFYYSQMTEDDMAQLHLLYNDGTLIQLVFSEKTRWNTILKETNQESRRGKS
ncbi:unnamed protein product [Rotaria sp. Silwood2]|nr:unnamed protein product [Rotaria sp. Silwood2]CAF3113902.1 unnamed protein product [Rotaria sp. Silwood2]